MFAKKLRMSLACLSTAFLLLPGTALAQAKETPQLRVVDHCMKSSSPGYENVETGIWRPMHEKMIEQGKKNSWALYRVLYGDRSQCDYHVIETYLGQDQQASSGEDIEKVFNLVHPRKKFMKAMVNTEASREMVSSSLLIPVDGVGVEPHAYATVNYLQADDIRSYLKMENTLWKPVHKALLDKGITAGWGVYRMAMPRGSAVGYNMLTVDFMNELKALPIAEVVGSVHPGMKRAELYKQTQATRSEVYSVTLELVSFAGGDS